MKSKYLKIVFCLVLSLVLISSSIAFADYTYDLSEESEVNSAGITLVPVRSFFENAHIPVSWDNSLRKILIGNNDYLTIDADSSLITMDGIEYTTSYSPTLLEGKSYLPIEFFTEYLDCIFDSSSDITIPEYILLELNRNIKTKSSIYQQPVESEIDFLNAVKAETGWNFAKALGEIGSSIEGLGFRGGGTSAGKEASDLVYAKFQELGLNPEYYDFPLYSWDFIDSSLSIIEKPDVNIPTVAAPGPRGTDETGITGELVFVGTGSKQDLEGVDLTGKIAVMELDMDYINWYAQAGYQVELHNAAGLIYYCKNYYGQDEEAFSIADWSGPEVDIPVLNTPKKYGNILKEMLEEDTLTATLISNVEVNENATGYNVVGMIPGTLYPEEYVIVDAHTDAFFYGFQDDSLAVGAMVAFAEAIKESGYEPDRTLVFCAFDSEEFGAMGVGTDWLVGSWNLLKEKKDEWSPKTVANLTLELMAYEGSEKLEMRSCDTLYDFISTIVDNLDLNAFDGTAVHNYVSTWSDEFSFSYHGIPTFRTHTDPEVTEMFYHSQFDTEDRASFEKYEDCLSTYGSLLIKFDKMAIAPYDLSLTPSYYLESINQEALTALGYDTSLYNAVSDYYDKAKELNRKNSLITKLLDEAVDEGKDITDLEDLIADYNQKQRDTAKTIIMGTQYLDVEDVAYQLPYYADIPGMFDTAIEALNNQDAEAAISALSLSGKYYSEFLDKETWYKTYQDSIVLDDPDREIFWATGRKLKAYDHYDLFESLRTKAENGSADFADEIETLKTFKTDALERVASSYESDRAVFEKASGELPLSLADELIDALK